MTKRNSYREIGDLFMLKDRLSLGEWRLAMKDGEHVVLKPNNGKCTGIAVPTCDVFDCNYVHIPKKVKKTVYTAVFQRATGAFCLSRIGHADYLEAIEDFAEYPRLVEFANEYEEDVK